MTQTDIGQRFRALAREAPKRIVFPEGTDPRVVEAAATCARERVCEPIILGNPDAVTSLAQEAGFALDGVTIQNPAEQLALDRYAHAYSERRQAIDEGTAHRILRRNLLFAAMVVSTGGADGMVAGATCPSARVLEAGGLAIGYQPGVSVPSSIFVMVLPDDWPAPPGLREAHLRPLPRRLGRRHRHRRRLHHRQGTGPTGLRYRPYENPSHQLRQLVD